MSPMRFQIIVLRFIAFWIRKTTTGMWSQQSAVSLLEEIEHEIEIYAKETGLHDVRPPWKRKPLKPGDMTEHGTISGESSGH